MNRSKALKIGQKILKMLKSKATKSQRKSLRDLMLPVFRREILHYAGIHCRYSLSEIRAAYHNLSRSARVNFLNTKGREVQSQIWHYLGEVEWQLVAHHRCFDDNFDYKFFHHLEYIPSNEH